MMNRAAFLKALGLTALAASIRAKGDDFHYHIGEAKVTDRWGHRLYEQPGAQSFKVPVPVAHDLEGLKQLGLSEEEIVKYCNTHIQLRYQASARMLVRDKGVTPEDIGEAVKNYRFSSRAFGPRDRRLPGSDVL